MEFSARRSLSRSLFDPDVLSDQRPWSRDADEVRPSRTQTRQADTGSPRLDLHRTFSVLGSRGVPTSKKAAERLASYSRRKLRSWILQTALALTVSLFLMYAFLHPTHTATNMVMAEPGFRTLDTQLLLPEAEAMEGSSGKPQPGLKSRTQSEQPTKLPRAEDAGSDRIVEPLPLPESFKAAGRAVDSEKGTRQVREHREAADAATSAGGRGQATQQQGSSVGPPKRQLGDHMDSSSNATSASALALLPGANLTVVEIPLEQPAATAAGVAAAAPVVGAGSRLRGASPPPAALLVLPAAPKAMEAGDRVTENEASIIATSRQDSLNDGELDILLQEVLAEDDHEEFVDVELESKEELESLEQDVKLESLSDEQMGEDGSGDGEEVEAEGAKNSAEGGQDMLDFILDGASMEVPEYNGVLFADMPVEELSTFKPVDTVIETIETDPQLAAAAPTQRPVRPDREMQAASSQGFHPESDSLNAGELGAEAAAEGQGSSRLNSGEAGLLEATTHVSRHASELPAGAAAAPAVAGVGSFALATGDLVAEGEVDSISQSSGSQGDEQQAAKAASAQDQQASLWGDSGAAGGDSVASGVQVIERVMDIDDDDNAASFPESGIEEPEPEAAINAEQKAAAEEDPATRALLEQQEAAAAFEMRRAAAAVKVAAIHKEFENRSRELEPNMQAYLKSVEEMRPRILREIAAITQEAA